MTLDVSSHEIRRKFTGKHGRIGSSNHDIIAFITSKTSDCLFSSQNILDFINKQIFFA